MKGRYNALAILALAVGTAGGIVAERHYFALPTAGDEGGQKILYWVAPMDPNFRRDAPGKSPMGMDLVPVYDGDKPAGDPGGVKLSPVEVNAIGVRTTVAQMQALEPRIETVGFVGFDEHRTAHVHVRTEGWIEDIRIRAVGDRVRQGDFLFAMYAPEISIAVSEFRRGLRVRSQLEIEAALGKLRNYGMTEQQIEELRRDPSATDRLRVYAPQDGVVVKLAANDGMFVKPDTEAMTLTDLSSVWLLADVFERDIGRLDPAMKAVARLEHLPGRRFEGSIDYINPELDAKTRTLPVRLRFDNGDGLLKPNMFAEVSLIGASGRNAVTVPAEAVIRTGRGERIILALPEGRFRPRIVTTGLKEGDRVEIVQGLQAGERVVASAQFLIDSESSLSAGFLRMAPTDDAPAAGKGALVALDLEGRRATIRHEAIESLDWPAMTTEFVLAQGVSPEPVIGADGTKVRFETARGSDGLLALVSLKADDGVDAIGTGTIHAVMAETGKVNLSHDPIPALGWPAMTMDLPIGPDVDPADIPLDQPLAFDLAKGDGAMYIITAVRPQETGRADTVMSADRPAKTMPMSMEMGADRGDAAAPILVGGTINSVNVEGRMADISHDDIEEIGMPGMTMAFPLAEGVDPTALPIGRRVEIGMRQGSGMMLEVVSVRTSEGS